MPKKVMDYSNCIIYKIVCNDLSVTNCYVGHTTNFIQRKRNHKDACINETSNKQHYKIYKFINENGGWNNFSMIEIEKWPCNDINEASARERYWFETLNANMNMQVPNRNRKEWVEDNRNYVLNEKKANYKKNKEHYLSLCKIYREQNRDKLIDYHKINYQQNKEKILQKAKEKYVCECGSIFGIYRKQKHFRTKKHLDFISASNKDNAEKTTQIEEVVNV